MLHSAEYSRQEYGLLAVVLVVVLFANIVSFGVLSSLAAHNPSAPTYPVVAGDSQVYAQLADNILTYHRFSSAPDLSPARQWPPGYPVFLAGVKALTGSFVLAVVLQVALELCALSLIFAMVRRYVPASYAALATLAFGLDPSVVLSNTTIISDGIFTSILIVGMYIEFFAVRPRIVQRFALAGILIGIATLIRPIAEFLTILLPLAYLLRSYLENGKLRTILIPAFAGYALCCAIVVGPWVARNYNVFGTFEIAHIGASDALQYDVRDFLAWKALGASPLGVFYPARHLNDPVFSHVDAQIESAFAESMPQGGNRDNYAGQVALHFVLEDPLRYTYFHLMQTVPFFLGSSTGTYEQILEQEKSNADLSGSTLNTAYVALANMAKKAPTPDELVILLPVFVEIVFWIFACIFALCGLYFARRVFTAWLFAALIIYFAVLTGALAIARYRIPVEPFLFTLAAIGIFGMLERMRTRTSTVSTVVKVFRYLISGATGLVINVFLYSILVFYIGVWYVAASIIAFLIALLGSFALQKFFAFRDFSPPGHGQQFVRYFAFMIFNMAANAAILFCLVQFAGIGRFIGVIFSNGIIATWSYFVYERIIFKHSARPENIAPSPKIHLSSISVVIPCYNEAESIPTVIKAIPKGVLEIIVVDNNSTDKSAEVARAHGAHVVSEMIQGYGAALRGGFLAARGEYIAAFDADNQYPADELPRILSFMEMNHLDFVSASRFPLTDFESMNLLRRIGNWGLTLAANVLFNLSLSDSQSGMWVFKRSLLGKILPQSNDMPFSQELKIRAAMDPAVRFAEYHIPYHVRIGESKLFPFRHGVKLLIALFVLRWKTWSGRP
ncbi:MAG TPA: glycosyltransferase [Candidatus Paceibacterota bacterium]|nr:glycosyltransferase [Candidatus Paceibacterota bacterium]